MHLRTYTDKNKAIKKSIEHSTDDARCIHRGCKNRLSGNQRETPKQEKPKIIPWRHQ